MTAYGKGGREKRWKHRPQAVYAMLCFLKKKKARFLSMWRNVNSIKFGDKYMSVTYFCVWIINIVFKFIMKTNQESMHGKSNLWQLEYDPEQGLPWRMESKLMEELMFANIQGFTWLYHMSTFSFFKKGKNY